ncbi:hypothetical protein A6V29_04955 [Blastococcus sp. CCUG 61487]|nr:hypothetical protein A6V29_04955 [Blastococcus sp. CCUG 61487]
MCTCGPGAWGTCDTCGVDAWIKHHCPFPCDDVTCEGGSICIGCLTGRPCPVHNDTEEDGPECQLHWPDGNEAVCGSCGGPL